MAGGPAAEAGLKPGDIVTQFNGRPAANANQLRNAVAATEPNTQMQIEVYRDGRLEKVSVVIGQLNADRLATVGSAAASNEQLGMQVETLTADDAQRLGYDQVVRGVVVTEIEPTGLAARVGIRRGDVVVVIGTTPIESVSDFRNALRDRSPEDGLRMQIMRDGVRRFVFLRSR